MKDCEEKFETSLKNLERLCPVPEFDFEDVERREEHLEGFARSQSEEITVSGEDEVRSQNVRCEE